MVKFVHLSDTHLGYRIGKGAINQWARENYSRPYEQEIYDTFLSVIKEITQIDGIDFVIHAGDMFHTPHQNNPYPPSDPARRTLIKGLELFFEQTNSSIPFIYIEGNHGIFRGYDYTPFETHVNKQLFPQLYYFTAKDMLDAIKTNQPLQLNLNFDGKKVEFYLFPYFEYSIHRDYENAYKKWLNIQQPKESRDSIAIAVVHGSKLDNTLHPQIINNANYDYIALGHEHAQRKENSRSYFSGALLPLNFKEIYHSQGYLVVDITASRQTPLVKSVDLTSRLQRNFEIIPIKVSPQSTKSGIQTLIESELKPYSSSNGFNPKTAARIKFDFQGELNYELLWTITNVMTQLRREYFSKPEVYNILQLIWKTSDISEEKEQSISAGSLQGYILENPELEFKNYIKELLTEETTEYDVDKLTKFGIEAINNALESTKKNEEG